MSERVNLTQLELRNKREDLTIAVSARNLLEDRLTSLIEAANTRGKLLYEQRLEVLTIVQKAKQLLAIAKATDPTRTDYTSYSATEHFFVSLKRGNVMGVRTPQLKLIGTRSTQNDRDYSWKDSNSQTDEVTNNFEDLMISLVRLGTEERNLRKIGEEIRKTQRRFNALDQILIPDLKLKISIIAEGIEEQDREELAKLQVFMRKREN